MRSERSAPLCTQPPPHCCTRASLVSEAMPSTWIPTLSRLGSVKRLRTLPGCCLGTTTSSWLDCSPMQVDGSTQAMQPMHASEQIHPPISSAQCTNFHQRIVTCRPNGAGSVLLRPRHQRPHRLQPPVPNHGRCSNHPGGEAPQTKKLPQVGGTLDPKIFTPAHGLPGSDSPNASLLTRPCQPQVKGHFEGIKLVYVGDGNNMVNSWLRLSTRFAYELVVCCPKVRQGGDFPNTPTCIPSPNLP